MAPWLRAAAGGGRARASAGQSQPWLPPAEGGVEINPWIVIGEDDRVLIRVNQSEVGQGVLTSNPMMICEELECDWSKVQSMFADPNRHVRENYAYRRLYTAAAARCAWAASSISRRARARANG